MRGKTKANSGSTAAPWNLGQTPAGQGGPELRQRRLVHWERRSAAQSMARKQEQVQNGERVNGKQLGNGRVRAPVVQSKG